MPELPELEVVREVLEREVTRRRIMGVDILRPTVVRDLTQEGFVEGLRGRAISGVWRRGKFIVLDLEAGRHLTINPMLAGRLQLAASGDKRLPRTALILRLDNGRELRYADRRDMGKVYLTDDLHTIPTWDEIGPDALDPALTLEVFRERLSRHRGEIKGILVNHRFVAGIGNAYADEICWHAQLYPFRRRPELTDEEIARLYHAMRDTLAEAIEQVRAQIGDEIHLKPREFLAVHNKGGAPCPRCGTPISQITARNRITSFCRQCQPGTLVRQ
ncbi:MAG TPA: Fpg/Nei family DNA glycosylase [Caldilineae bacterium]|nr:Fpg/Nei family DNA glycosylase [Caldilineae bacterium]